MKVKIIYIFIPLIIFIGILSSSIYGYLNGVTDMETYNISVIVESTNKEGWAILKQGIESACEAYHAEVNFIVMSDYNDIGEYVKVIQREIQNGTDGLILNIQNNERLSVKLDEILTQREVVLLESEIPISKGYTYISPDNYQMGFELGVKMKDNIINGEKIGIISGSDNNLADIDRKKGVQEALKDRQIQWEDFDDKEYLFEQRVKISSLQKYITLNNAATEALTDIVKEEPGGRKIYGVGNSEKIVYYLDRGIIEQLVVPNEYMMGYMGVKAIYDRLNYNSHEEQINIDYILVNKETLYEEDNQKLMFPIVQ